MDEKETEALSWTTVVALDLATVVSSLVPAPGAATAPATTAACAISSFGGSLAAVCGWRVVVGRIDVLGATSGRPHDRRASFAFGCVI